MTVETIGNPLQYGALGILLVVLIGLAKSAQVLFAYFKTRDQASQTVFINLLENAAKQQQAHAAAWQQLSQMAITAMEENKKNLSAIQKAIEHHEAAAVVRQEKLVVFIDRCCTTNHKASTSWAL